MNQHSLDKLKLVHPILSARVIKLQSLLPFELVVAQGLRTWKEQDQLYAQIPRVTKARGGYSAHNFGYAVDLCPLDAQGKLDWNISHPCWSQLLTAGLECKLAEGAKWRSFPDNPHFYLSEFPTTPTDEMRALYPQGLATIWKLIPVTE